MHRRPIAIILFVVALSLLSVQASACSLVLCLGRGLEMRPSFVVNLSHDDKPLAGVTVRISTSAEGTDVIRFTEATAENGTVHVTNLAPGDYWITAEFLGINAAYHCFHVKAHRSRTAKRELAYQWGDTAPRTRQVAGKLIDSQRAKTSNPLWNLIHTTDVPITNARLRLRHPISNATFETWSDTEGTFAFGEVTSGTYVLLIDGGRAGERDYDGTELLIEVDPRVSRETLLLKRREAGFGSCGGTSLELDTLELRPASKGRTGSSE